MNRAKPTFDQAAREMVVLLEAKLGDSSSGPTDDSALLESLTQLIGALGGGEATLVDVATGLLDRRAWDRFLLAEEERSRRYGNGAGVVVVEVQPERPDDLKRAAEALRSSSRAHDLVARVGGHKLAVLATECKTSEIASMVARLEDRLVAAGVSASIGVSCRDATQGLLTAFEEAEHLASESRI